MKTRDIIKYALALVIAGITIGSIAALEYSRALKREQGAEERQRIQERLQLDAQQAKLPAAVTPVPSPTASAAPTLPQ